MISIKENMMIQENTRTVASGYLALVVLCGEENAQPVLNTGSMY
jgi:hypothetical protein